ncbi:uncharacterized protein LOC119488031 isoform X1 [Sebastes umbrosus]|uniref:uncharacterized protein LOC119488031 isoform X1 n=1 Tax=Sebastes umbrosus TaxID=72105 RepID=UPI0018A01BDD|nr:uncharacterized protein LOC119488031 isoform X1 [Sebastes umbrosus]
MVDNIVSKPFGLVLIVTAHLVFNGPTQAEVIGILGDRITFEFTFNKNVTQKIAVYTNNTKIAEYKEGNIIPREGDFYVYPKDTSVFVHIINLKLNHSGIYSASFFTDTSVIESNNKVQLIVREENRSSTDLPVTNDKPNNEDEGSPSISSHIVTVLVVLPVVLLAAVLPLLIWCLLRTNDERQQPPPQENSNPTVQETIEASNNVPASQLVYSVLDFPKRPQTVLDINPNDTEYAAVSYLQEKRQV